MADKKPGKFETDDWDADSSLDMPDFDFDAKEPSDDRKPSTKIATSFAAGAKDSVLNAGFLRNQIKTSLPKGYGQGLDLVDQSAATLRNLYNTSATELKPMVNDLKRTTKRLMPVASKFLPKTAADMIGRWADDTKKSGQLSAEEIRDQGINSQLGEIFKYQQEQEGKDKAESDAKAGIQEQISQVRHRDTLGQLDAIRIQASALVQYQNKITSQYQRKSLELQYRQYFVAMDSFEEQKKINVTTTEHLANIAKNTALPEYVKITQSERLAEMMRNRFMGGIADSIFDKRRGFMRNFQGNLVKAVKGKVNGFAESVRSGLSMADSVMDMQEMQAELGGGPSTGELAANMAGGAVGENLGNRAGKWIGKQLGKHKGVRKWGNKLAYTAENLPQMAWEYAAGNKHDDGPLGGLVRLGKEAMGNGRIDYSMGVDSIKDMQGPAIFSNQTRKTINEIIPGFLARIYQELQIIRTGDTNVDLLRYDFGKNRFSADKAMRNDVYKDLIKQDDINSNKEDMEKLLNDVDPNKKLSPEARKALGEQLLRDNLNNREASADRLSNYDTWTGSAAKHGDEISDHFKEYFKGDDEDSRKLKFSQQYNRLGRGMSDIREQVQQYLNLGLHDIVRDIGLIDPDSGDFNQRMLMNYWDGSTKYSPQLQRGKGKLGGGRLGGFPGRANPQIPPPPPFPQLPTPTPPHDPSGGGSVVGRLDTTKLESLITEANTKPQVVEIVDILGRIEKGLEKGINLNLTDDDADPNSVRGRKRKRFSDWTVRDGIDGAADGLKWGFDKGSNLASKVWKGAWENGNKLRKKAMEGFSSAKDWAKGKLDDFSDVYIEGRLEPLLQSWRLQSGKYVDEATGVVLKKWSDAKGAIRDTETGELITVEQMKDAFSKTKYGKALFTKIGELKDWGVKQIGRGINMANTVYGTAWELAKKAYNQLDQPCDVYVPGHEGPVLTAVTMRGGGYFSRVNGHAITKPSQIDGPVVNDKKEEVLSEEMLKKGLYDQNGVALHTGWKKIVAYGVAGIRKGWDKLKKLGSWAKDKATGFWNGASDMLGGALGKIVGPDGLVIAGGSKINDRLTMIYELLDDRLPGGGHGRAHVVGDSDGDGVRDGSLKDQALKAKAAAAEKLKSLGEAGKEKGKGLYDKGATGLASILAKWRKEEKEHDEESGGDTSIDLGEGGDHGKDGKKETREERKARKLREKAARSRDPRYKGWKGKLRNGARIGRNAGGALGRGLATAGRIGLAGAGLLGEGALATAGAVGSGALTVGSAALGAIPAIAGSVFSAAGTLAAGIAGFISAPVVLGALAVGAVGAAGYYGYKALTKKRLKPLNTVRYAQYGFLSGDEEHLQAVMGLEDKVFDGVKFEKDVATLSMEGLNVKSMAESFGLDMSNKAAVNSWFFWFRDRFKPVYLTALTAAYKTNPKVKLGNIDDDFTATEKQTYLNLAKFPEGPYGVTYSPFDPKGKLAAGSAEVKTAVDMATVSIEKELADKPATEKDKLAQAAALGKGGASATDLKQAEITRLQDDQIDKAKAAQKLQDRNAGRLLIGGGLGDYSVKGAALPKSRIAGGRIDALTCVRYKTYGLKDMELPRVRALDMLEEEVEKTLDFGGDGIAVWKGDPQKLLASQGGNFGVSGVTNSKAFDWLAWFNYRFLPVYLNYATAVKRNTNRVKPSQGLDALKPTQQVDVATAIYTTNSNYDSRMLSVFQVSKSPWGDYVLNSDVKSVDDNMRALKDAAKNAVLSQTVGKLDAATLAKPENALLKSQIDRFAEKKGVDFNKNPSMLLSTVEKGKNIDYTKFTGGMQGGRATGYSMLLGGTGSYSGGQAVQHPGNGTGGDINSLPNATGKGWKAMGPVILGAAKMAGFDPNLMASIAAVESGFDPSIGAGTSSATGLYQFLDSTWATMLRKYGAKYGIAPGTPATDARANALMGAEFMKENLAGLQGSLDRPITDTDIYMAHFLGLGGARKFLSASPDTNATQLMPEAANANRSIFFDGARARTTGEIYQQFSLQIKNKKAQFGVGDLSGGGSGQAAEPATPTGMPNGAPSSAPAVPAMLAPMGGPKAPAGLPTAASLLPKPATTAPGPATPAGPAPSSMPVSTNNPLGVPVAETSSAPVAQTLVTAAPVVAAPKAPSSMPNVDPEVAASSLSISPRARSVDAQQADQSAAALSNVGNIILQGNEIQKAQLSVMKEVLAAVKQLQVPQKQAPAAQQAQPRTVGDTPMGPISMKKSQ